jgi:hypothetical protein
VTGEGVKQPQVPVGVVDDLPVEVAHDDVLEQAAAFDLLAVVGSSPGRGRAALSGSPTPISS